MTANVSRTSDSSSKSPHERRLWLLKGLFRRGFFLDEFNCFRNVSSQGISAASILRLQDSGSKDIWMHHMKEKFSFNCRYRNPSRMRHGIIQMASNTPWKPRLSPRPRGSSNTSPIGNLLLQNPKLCMEHDIELGMRSRISEWGWAGKTCLSEEFHSIVWLHYPSPITVKNVGTSSGEWIILQGNVAM
jgi:hypothetical protein